jgi:predicted ThiF/HesA family dinucleotide-utilizing enzyme
MAEPVRVRRLTGEEGAKLQRLVRRGEGQGKASVVRYRRALVVLSSAGGNTVPVIARLVQTSEDRVREVIHNFNKTGMACLDPSGRVAVPAR